MLSERYDRALVWAADIHRTQTRKGGDIPYLSHLLAVSSLVIEHGGDEDQAIAGLLHDAIEDCDDVHEADVARRFGPRVAAIVVACSDRTVTPKPPWLPRKQSYLAHLAEVEADVLLVSLADKTHNARTIAIDVERDGEAFFARFNGGADGSRWYYRRLADAYRKRLHELPAEVDAQGVPRAGGPSLLAEYEAAIARFGASPEAAASFEATL